MPRTVAPWRTTPNPRAMRRPSRLGGRRHGDELACAAAAALGTKNGNDRPPDFEQDVPRLPLVEAIVTRRGIRQQHAMMARCGPHSGRCDRREPLAREGRRARPGAAPAAFQAQESRRGTSGVPVCGRRACPGGRRVGTPRQGRPPTGRGQPLARSPRQWRRCASSSVRCRCPSPPASRGSGGIRPAWPGVANCCHSRRAGTWRFPVGPVHGHQGITARDGYQRCGRGRRLRGSRYQHA